VVDQILDASDLAQGCNLDQSDHLSDNGLEGFLEGDFVALGQIDQFAGLFLEGGEVLS
jgi:hypothetical protein